MHVVDVVPLRMQGDWVDGQRPQRERAGGGGGGVGDGVQQQQAALHAPVLHVA